MIKEWLASYKTVNHAAAEQALREIMQEIALAGLQRAGFFEKAAFYGDTALRVFHGLERFSEDLDFSLMKQEKDFSFQPYLDKMLLELESLGMKATVSSKRKSIDTAVDSAFLKPDTEWKELMLKEILPEEKIGLRPEIKIKLEIDTHPPQGFETEEKLLLKPYSFYVKCFTPPDLFAGKLHALLFRKWKNRVKGRDWFDLEFYIRRGIPVRLEHLALRARDSGDWKYDSMDAKQLTDLLDRKIDQVSFNQIKEDVRRFIPDSKILEIWSPAYFHELVKHMTFK